MTYEASTFHGDVIFYVYRPSEVSLSQYLKTIALFIKGLSLLSTIHSVD